MTSVLDLLGVDFLADKAKDDFTLRIDGKEVPVVNGTVHRRFDAISDSWSAVVPWDPGTRSALNLPSLSGYQDTEIFLGGQKALSGRVYKVTNSGSRSGATKTLEGAAYTADLVDSSVSAPFQYKNALLGDIIADQILDTGIDFITDPKIRPLIAKPFKRVACRFSDKIFAFLVRLAKQKNTLLSCNHEGKLWVTLADVTSKPVGTISDAKYPGFEYKITVDGRKRFNLHQLIAQSPGRKRKIKKNFKSEIVYDSNVPPSRRINFKVDASALGDLKKTANWYRSRQIVEALTLPYPVIGWHAPNGSLWAPNTMVTVKSDYLELPKGFTFFINGVEYRFGTEGTTATLHLMPPGAYSGQDTPDPWSESTLPTTGLLDKLVAESPLSGLEDI